LAERSSSNGRFNQIVESPRTSQKKKENQTSRRRGKRGTRKKKEKAKKKKPKKLVRWADDTSNGIMPDNEEMINHPPNHGIGIYTTVFRKILEDAPDAAGIKLLFKSKSAWKITKQILLCLSLFLICALLNHLHHHHERGLRHPVATGERIKSHLNFAFAHGSRSDRMSLGSAHFFRIWNG
jgi:hypothetical protein